ncbi:hypothetical protein K5549_017620, partial [Capra hircus]
GASEERFEVSVWPDQALVKYGQSLTVNCSTTCPDPGPGGIETLLKKTEVGRGPQWKKFLLEDVTQNSILQCFFSCAGIQKDINLGITVYQPPEQVIVELQPAWVAVDEAFTVTCRVPRVTPLENLTLTLLQDDRELRQKKFRSLAMASQRAEVTINVKARWVDDRCNFSCRAELDLNSRRGGLFHSSSALQILRIFGSRELLATVPTLWGLIQFIMAFLFSSVLLISWQNFLRARKSGSLHFWRLGWQKRLPEGYHQ